MEKYLQNFTKIFCRELTLHKHIKPENIILTHGNSKGIYIIDRNDINDIPNTISRYFLEQIPKTLYNDGLIRFCQYNMGYEVYPYINYRNIEDEEIYYIRNQNLLVRNKEVVYLIFKLRLQNESYYIEYWINNNILSNIYSGKREYKTPLVYEIIALKKKLELFKNFNNKLLLENFLEKESFSQDSYNIKNNILKDTISLYDYQLNDIKWMKSIEDDVIKGENRITINYSYTITDLDKFILSNKRILPISSVMGQDYTKTDIDRLNAFNDKFSMEYYGGNLISDLGLGKTIICLYHIFSSCDNLIRKKYNKFVTFNDGCNYFYKRGSKKGNNCKEKCDENKMYCKIHESSLFQDKKDIILQHLEEFDTKDFICKSKYKNSNLIKTNSSLIICPSHLCDQWIQEYYDKFIDNKRVILIITKNQYDNVTLADILFSDIVIVSYNFLMSTTYQNSLQHRTSDIIDKQFLESSDIKKLLLSKKFNLFDLFMWDKVILDEPHEIQNISKSILLLNGTINHIESSFRWNITGTPFANGIKGYMNIMSHNTNLDYLMCNKVGIFDFLRLKLNSDIIDKSKKLFRRNTKESVKQEYIGNVITENVKLIEFTNQERNIYNGYLKGGNSKYSDFLIKLCCHCELHSDTKILIKNCKTLTELQSILFTHNKEQLDNLNLKIKSIQNEIEIIQKELNDKELNDKTNVESNDKTNDKTNDEINDKVICLKNLKRTLTLFKNKSENLERTCTYLKYTFDNLKNSHEPCPICLDNIEEDNIGLTSCGHKFCWDCLSQLYKSKNTDTVKCPKCNIYIKNCFLLKESENIEENELSSIVNSIKSSKIGNVIYFLKNISKNEKIIIFSQWDELLHLVGEKLEKYNLNIVYCNGSVFKRKKTIESFRKNPDINIIMLSSTNAASGINLTEANTIILLEPIYGSKEYRKSIENQAIGRSDRIGQNNPIKVYRFIVKDTIEEDILNDNIDDLKMEKLTL